MIKYLLFFICFAGALCGNCCSTEVFDRIKEVADMNGLKVKTCGYRLVILDDQLAGSLDAARRFFKGECLKNTVMYCPYTIAVIASPGVTQAIFEELGVGLTSYGETGGSGAALDVHIQTPQIVY